MNLLKTPLGRLRVAGFVEGITLLCLLVIAVPMKHVAGFPQAVATMGPVHGVSFVMYLVLACSVVFDGNWSTRQIIQTILVSIIPFGTFMNDRLIVRKQRELIAHV